MEELTAVRQTLQADLETSIRRIVDLQAALEEVESSDESDAERFGFKLKHSNQNLLSFLTLMFVQRHKDQQVCRGLGGGQFSTQTSADNKSI